MLNVKPARCQEPIELSGMPDFRRDALIDFAWSTMRELFSKPGVEGDFQRWLDERKKKQLSE